MSPHGDAGDVVLKVCVVRVHTGDGAVDVSVTQHLAAHLHPVLAARVISRHECTSDSRIAATSAGFSTGARWATAGMMCSDRCRADAPRLVVTEAHHRCADG
jgi:hypothetical protein